jgi:hypothetical protein
VIETVTIAAPPAPSTITTALPCLRCEYDLRGLPRDAHCPECGTPVEPSAARNDAEQAGEPVSLSLSATSWLRATGVACWLTVAFAFLTFAEAFVIVSNIGERSGMNYLSGGLAMAQLAAMLIVLWLFGTREPLASRCVHAAGYFVRAVALVLTAAPFALLPVMMRYGVGRTRLYSHVAVGFAVIAGLLTWSIVRRLAAGARRDRRMMLARSASAFAWLAPIAWVVHAVLDPSMPIGQSAGWMVNAHPLIGYAESVVAMGRLLLFAPMRTDPMLLPWLIEAANSLAGVVLFAAMARLFLAAARQSPRPAAADATSPVAPAGRTAASSRP